MKFIVLLLCIFFIQDGLTLDPGRVTHFGGAFRKILVSDKRMYVLKGSRSVEIYDITRPEDPRLLGKTTSPLIENANKIEAWGHYLFVLDTPENNEYCGDWENSVHVFDTTDPKNIIIEKPLSRKDEVYARDMAIEGNKLYLVGCRNSHFTSYEYRPQLKKFWRIHSHQYGNHRELSNFVHAHKGYVLAGGGESFDVLKEEKEDKYTKLSTHSFYGNGYWKVRAVFSDEEKLYLDMSKGNLYELDLSASLPAPTFKQVELAGVGTYDLMRTMTANALVVVKGYKIFAFDKKTRKLLSSFDLPFLSNNDLASVPGTDVFYLSNNEGDNGLMVFTLEANQIKHVKTFQTMSSVQKVISNDDFLIYSYVNSNRDHGVKLAKIQDDTVFDLGSIKLKYITDFQRKGDRLYVSTSELNNNFHLYDISNFEAPKHLETIDASPNPISSKEYPQRFEIYGEKIIIMQEGGLGFVNIYDLNLKQISHFLLEEGPSFGCCFSLAFKENSLYHAGRNGLLWVYDLSDLSEVTVKEPIKTHLIGSRGLYLKDNHLFFLGYLGAFSIFDVSIAANPTYLKEVETSQPNEISIENGRGISRNQREGHRLKGNDVVFWDFSAPNNPVEIETWRFFGQVTSVLATEERFYVTAPRDGIYIVK